MMLLLGWAFLNSSLFAFDISTNGETQEEYICQHPYPGYENPFGTFVEIDATPTYSNEGNFDY